MPGFNFIFNCYKSNFVCYKNIYPIDEINNYIAKSSLKSKLIIELNY